MRNLLHAPPRDLPVGTRKATVTAEGYAPVALSAVALVGGVVFMPAITGGWIYDDKILIADNQFVHSFSAVPAREADRLADANYGPNRICAAIQKDNVKTLTKDVFARIDQLAAPRLVEYWEQDPCLVEPPVRPYKEGEPDRKSHR